MKKAVVYTLIIIGSLSCRQKGNPNKSIAAQQTLADTDSTTAKKDNKQIEGVYTAEPINDEVGNCDITVTITKKKQDYFFSLETDSKTINGKVTLTKNKETANTIIMFEGIPWDEYEGNLDAADSTDTELEIPIGIDGMLKNDTITIQNSGNSMNSYTKFLECGYKYIHLVRKQKG